MRTLTRDGRAVIYDGRRWRIRVKVGHYRFGLSMRANPAWGPRWETGSFGAGVITGNWVRRTLRNVDPAESAPSHIPDGDAS